MGVKLAFLPISGDHAISEVVFGLTFSRPFSLHELEKVAKSHNEWRSELPRLNRLGGGIELVFGQFGAVPTATPSMGGGVSFERIKPDGSLDWRVLIDQNNVFVNCLSYTRWNEIWPKAESYIRRILGISGAVDTQVSGAILQYIDIFRWNGDISLYDIAQMLQPGHYVPESLFKKGPFWHLHQGWFEPNETGRILERIHLDALEDEYGVPIVRLDTYMNHQLAGFISQTESFETSWLTATFESMHKKNKELLASFITKEMADRISLNVAG